MKRVHIHIHGSVQDDWTKWNEAHKHASTRHAGLGKTHADLEARKLHQAAAAAHSKAFQHHAAGDHQEAAKHAQEAFKHEQALKAHEKNAKRAKAKQKMAHRGKATHGGHVKLSHFAANFRKGQRAEREVERQTAGDSAACTCGKD